jgi:hypothetical protein
VCPAFDEINMVDEEAASLIKSKVIAPEEITVHENDIQPSDTSLSLLHLIENQGVARKSDVEKLRLEMKELFKESMKETTNNLIEDERREGKDLEANLREESMREITTEQKDDGKYDEVALPEDTFSLMMVSQFLSFPWLIGFGTFAFQMILLSFVCLDMFIYGNFLAQFALRVDPIVSCAQFFVLFAVFFIQSDLIEAVRNILLLKKDDIHSLLLGDGRNSDADGRNSDAGQVVSPVEEGVIDRDHSSASNGPLGGEKEGSDDGNNKNLRARFVFANVFKLAMAIVTITVTVGLTITSYTILDLLKDFAALMFITELDNLVFKLLVKNGLNGMASRKKADEISKEERKITVKIQRDGESKWRRVDVWIVSFIYGVAVAASIWILVLQIKGDYAIDRKCKVEFSKLRDNICNGGAYNTP